VRVGFPGGPRLEWYDRNPQIVWTIYHGIGIAPHTSTQRASYTVPTGKKASLEFISLFISRTTAPTTSGQVRSMATYTPSGGSIGWALIAAFNSATVDFTDKANVGHAGALQAGDNLSIYTADASTGGTCEYRENIKVTEFDA